MFIIFVGCLHKVQDIVQVFLREINSFWRLCEQVIDPILQQSIRFIDRCDSGAKEFVVRLLKKLLSVWGKLVF